MVHGLETMAALNEAAVEDASVAPAGVDRYEKYRLAGELFGRLKDELGWGDLTMSFGTRLATDEVRYEWWTTVRGVRYTVTHSIWFREAQGTPVERLASDLSTRWKNMLRRKVGDDRPTTSLFEKPGEVFP